MAKHLALPWYDREHWLTLHKLFVERESMPIGYDLWKQRALRAERRYTKKGYRVVRVRITPEALETWCADIGCAVTLNARHAFAQQSLAARRTPQL